ncbi:DNA replication licensing factor MCM7 [Culex quinquefasciatus]|uniref:DNA replication licensing factor MCM7 n=1 Tax=Culex quinquefasciatus TaxID=7176 RepID=B0X250_CULQU|nr:DNA replication licensing factor MCM7 [Culex quinquefasciatus]|eukprot:XP_001863722.1 DNA replication licensing factor MCM7 [Culex quinquefasciatus]
MAVSLARIRPLVVLIGQSRTHNPNEPHDVLNTIPAQLCRACRRKALVLGLLSETFLEARQIFCSVFEQVRGWRDEQRLQIVKGNRLANV